MKKIHSKNGKSRFCWSFNPWRLWNRKIERLLSIAKNLKTSAVSFVPFKEGSQFVLPLIFLNCTIILLINRTMNKKGQSVVSAICMSFQITGSIKFLWRPMKWRRTPFLTFWFGFKWTTFIAASRDNAYLSENVIRIWSGQLVQGHTLGVLTFTVFRSFNYTAVQLPWEAHTRSSPRGPYYRIFPKIEESVCVDTYVARQSII